MNKLNENNKPEELKAYFGENDSGFGSCLNLDNSEFEPFISSRFTFIGDEQSIIFQVKMVPPIQIIICLVNQD